MDQKKVVDFLGIRLNNLTAEEILDHVDQCIAQRKNLPDRRSECGSGAAGDRKSRF